MKKKSWKKKLPAWIFLLLLVLLWQLAAVRMNAAYILPTPMQILEKIWELRVPLFTEHLPATMNITLIGLGISLVLGVLLAILMDASEILEEALYPIVVVTQTIPTMAIAPLFVVWFGYGIWERFWLPY